MPEDDGDDGDIVCDRARYGNGVDRVKDIRDDGV